MATAKTEPIPVHPHLFFFSTKRAHHVDFVQGAKEGTKSGNLSATTKEFFASLTTRRDAVLTVLGSTSEVPENVDSTLTSYLSRLNHLLLPPDDKENTDESANPALRGLWGFNWGSGLGGCTVEAKDVHFEVVSVLVSVALWKARKASELLSGGGVDMSESPELPKCHKLLREAAGLVAHALKVVERVGEYPCVDCSKSGLNGLLNTFLAEAQSLTALRAMAKNHEAPSIASITWDVHTLYAEALSALKNAGAKGMKLLNYLEYKAAVFSSFAMSFHSAVRLAAMEGGEAVRLAQEAKKESDRATQLGGTFDASTPRTKPGTRAQFHDGFVKTVNKALTTAEQDNSKVYFKPVPQELPEMPESKRLVEIVVFSFPSPDSAVDRSSVFKADWMESMMPPGATIVLDVKDDAGAEQKKNGEAKEDQGSSWWRWLIVIFTIPLLVAITLVGVIVWIILLPIKCLCCPVGCAAQLLWNVFEWIVKAPLRAVLWASGKPWKPTNEPKDKDAKKNKT